MLRSLMLCLMLLGLPMLSAEAVIIVTEGADLISSPTATASFTSVLAGDDLSAYIESGISVTVAGTSFLGFDPSHGFAGTEFVGSFHYPSGGATGATSISFGGATMYGVEFTIGDGFAGPGTFYWYSLSKGGVVVASGSGSITDSGTNLSFTDADITGGWDLLMIGASSDAATAAAAFATPTTSFNAVAIDNLEISTTVVPEPGSYALALLLLLCGIVRRRSCSGDC